MENSVILSHVDHTLLKASATWSEIQKLCNEAVAFKTASVCVSPSYVKRIFSTYGGKLPICTVIGFPLGYNTTETKLFETVSALNDGADEIDMVINIGDLKNEEFDNITAEISSIKKAVGDKILKVIIETCYLTQQEKVLLCQCVTESGADYIKTSTGFGTNGATLSDVLLFKENIGKNVKIKAAGGIRTKEDMIEFLKAGCTRLGTSSAIKILLGEQAEGY